MVTDSIPKLIPGFGHLYHDLRRGATVTDIIRDVRRGYIKIGGHNAVLLHVGTNSLRVKRNSCAPEPDFLIPAKDVIAQLTQLRDAIRAINYHCIIIFSSILPRPCDHDQTGPEIELINAAMKAWAQSEMRVAFIDSAAPFTYQDGALRGQPQEALFTHRDWLHLNNDGLHLLAKSWEAHLSPSGLRAIAAGVQRPAASTVSPLHYSPSYRAVQ